VVTGDINKISLSSSSFERMITEGRFYVDKTPMIEHFLNNESEVQLIARQRRLGKSLNMDMLRCFLTDRQDLRHLFKGLYIETRPVWSKAYTAPVFYFDFKELQPKTYKEQIIDKMVDHVCSFTDPDSLDFALKRKFKQIIDNPDRAIDCLYFLTEMAYKLTGKRSYLLIDEYDKLLTENSNSAMYEEIRSFETALLSAGLKGNQYLEKALLTGVMRISHKSLLSGLNNVVTFDVFHDGVYTDDYGLTEDEVKCLNKYSDFDIGEMRSWYNGIRIGGHAIYNIYSVMSYLLHKNYSCFWGKSGTLDMIINLLNDRRKLTLVKLLNGELVEVAIDNRISLMQMDSQVGDEAFYSLLVQAGYLALVQWKSTGLATVSIPNQELKMVWKNFILSRFYADLPQVKELFDNSNNPTLFSKDLEYFLSDRLSYHDLASYKSENVERAQERAYHIYLLGLLSAYDDMRFKYPLSNRESGDGRYDVLVERSTAYYIFELKTCSNADDLSKHAKKALNQIESMRYGADLKNPNKRLVKVGIAICGKLCKVMCAVVSE